MQYVDGRFQYATMFEMGVIMGADPPATPSAANGPANAGAGIGSRNSVFRIVVHPYHGPRDGVDVTEILVDAVAQVLWKLQGGSESTNRLEARALLEQAMGRPANDRHLESTP